MCKYLKQLLLVSFMLFTWVLNAQEVKLARAQTLLSEKKIDQAKLCIDSVITHPETSKRFESWTTRAYIYFEIYKKTDKTKLNSNLRDTIVASLKRSRTLKPDADYQSNNNKLFTNLALTYFNISKSYLHDSVNYESSLLAFNRYKELYKFADSTFKFKDKEIEFNLAVGSLYSQKFNDDQTNAKAFEIAKVALLKVLELNPNEPSANMNMGLMYLQQAIKIVQASEAGEINLAELDVLQDNSLKLGKQAEPFLLKAYEQDKLNKKAVLALYYTYRVLNDIPKRDAFLKKCQELKIEVESSANPQK